MRRMVAIRIALTLLTIGALLLGAWLVNSMSP